MIIESIMSVSITNNDVFSTKFTNQLIFDVRLYLFCLIWSISLFNQIDQNRELKNISSTNANWLLTPVPTPTLVNLMK